MSLSHRYSSFSVSHVQGHVPERVEIDQVEDAKLQSFEEGYRAGWDDAVKAYSDDKDKIADAFSQNLQDMSFTFHEAFAKLGTAMEPLLSQIVSKVLPELADKTLAAHVVVQMKDLMTQQAGHAIEIAVCPLNLNALTEILSETTNIPFEIKGEPALGDGQVYLRVNTQEREINLNAVTEGIANALDAFFQQIEQETQDD